MGLVAASRSRKQPIGERCIWRKCSPWRCAMGREDLLNSRRKMTSDKLVRVEKEGTVLEGVGFESDPNLQHFEFQRQIRATVQPGVGALAAPKQGKK